MKKIALRSLLAAFLLMEALNLTGFCFKQWRFLSDDELMDRAVEYALQYSRGPWKKGIAKASDFYEHFPRKKCCRVNRWSQVFSKSLTIDRLFGFYMAVVHVNTPDMQAFVGIDKCGRRLKSYRMPN